MASVPVISVPDGEVESPEGVEPPDGGVEPSGGVEPPGSEEPPCGVEPSTVDPTYPPEYSTADPTIYPPEYSTAGPTYTPTTSAGRISYVQVGR